ncbi:MAG: phosphatase [Lachnospiraceae bacterium]
MSILMDMHTHTMASGHGYSTLKENIEAAKAKGLKALGLSEHGPAMPGGPHIYFLSNYRCIPRQYGDLKLFCGVEANICDYRGGLDVDEDILAKMDYVIASMHVQCCRPGSITENTKASILAMKNPYVKVLGHPDDSRYPIDRKELVLAAKEAEVAIEINNSSLNPKAARIGGRENIKELFYWCNEYKVSVLLGTDSHICYTVGDFTETLQIVEELKFPKELILNYDMANLKRICNILVE